MKLLLLIILVGFTACDSKNSPAPVANPQQVAPSHATPQALAAAWIYNHEQLDEANTAIVSSWSQPEVLRVLKIGDDYVAVVGDDSAEVSACMALKMSPHEAGWKISAVKATKSNAYWPSL